MCQYFSATVNLAGQTESHPRGEGEDWESWQCIRDSLAAAGEGDHG